MAASMTAADAVEYERVLLVQNEVFVYRIPPRQSNRGYKAADWGLDKPDWTGRLRIVSKADDCIIKLEDKTSGELFAACPILTYPGSDVEQVMDSSRYFVLRILDDTGRKAFIGIGFADRADSFDLNVTLQEHFKWAGKEQRLDGDQNNTKQPKLDLAFKEGQTITIKNVNVVPKKSKNKPASTLSGIGVLPPPPGGNIPLITPPPPPATGDSNGTPPEATGDSVSKSDSSWGDFSSASSSSEALQQATTSSTEKSEQDDLWVQF